jgi:hypothetical protein
MGPPIKIHVFGIASKTHLLFGDRKILFFAVRQTGNAVDVINPCEIISKNKLNSL